MASQSDQEHGTPFRITLFSFGFKHGYPEADLVLDVRFLPNPYWIPELKAFTGQNETVASYVLENDAGREFRDLLKPFLQFLVTQYRAAGKPAIRIAIGCTGGKHRSVAVTEYIADFITTGHDAVVETYHRDINKE